MNFFVWLLALVVSGESFWSVQTTGMDTSLRGVSVTGTGEGTGKEVVWVSGSNGAVLRSVDGGKSWERIAVAGGEKLDFRAIQAFDARTAYAMSAGDGNQSRIYKTEDGGKTWRKQYEGPRREIFLDGLVCRSEKECFVVGDPVDGKFLLLRTGDGEKWEVTGREAMPGALKGEGAFAASNSSMAWCGKSDIYFGTGGPAARVFHSNDLGQSWTVTETPIQSGNAASGIFSLGCEGERIVAVGGDYQKAEGRERTAAYSQDGGKTWRLAEEQPSGYRSAVVRMGNGRWLALGTNGADESGDGGGHWSRKSGMDWNAVVASGGRVWAVGPKGTVARTSE